MTTDKCLYDQVGFNNKKTNIVKLKIGILIFFLCQIVQAQQSKMTENRNTYNSDFIASSTLKEKFNANGNSTNEFELIAQFNTDEKTSVFVKNNSKDSISLSHQDYSLYLLQEAKDENGLWQPIEYWESSSCGNSFGQIRIAPYGIIETNSERYHGDFKTTIRFKLSVNNKLYYSNELSGNINKKQFILPDDLNAIWPLHIVKEGLSMELKQKVIFLEPYGLAEFYEVLEQPRNLKKKK